MRQDFRAEATRLGDIRRFVEDNLEGMSIPRKNLDDIRLAVTEACTNAILHSGGPTISVTIHALPDRIEVRVDDDGEWRPPADPGDEGNGLPIMRALMDEVYMSMSTPSHAGYTVMMVKYRGERP